MSTQHQKINAENCSYCYIDLDFDNYRKKLATAAAFVDATDSRYGFSSKDLRYLGGSELSRITELIATDHEWETKNSECDGIEIRPPSYGNRIIIKLFWDITPITCENFATLCSNGGSSLQQILLSSDNNNNNNTKTTKPKPPPIGESGKPLTYRGSTIHRIIPGFILQGGDFVFGNGSGGESIYNGKKFKDERPGLQLKHDRKGLVSMGNSGKNSNTSQFFITFNDVSNKCDGKHVIFGEMISGYEVLQQAELYGSSSSSSGDGTPTVPITITDCGIYKPLFTPACGYWYDQPDLESYTGISPTFMIRPRIVVVGPNTTVLDKFQKAVKTYVSFQGLVLSDNNDNDDQIVATKIMELLGSFSVDVVLIAPACKRIKNLIQLPSNNSAWVDLVGDDGDNIVIMETKPVEALATVWQKSWLSKEKKRPAWQLDGCVS